MKIKLFSLFSRKNQNTNPENGFGDAQANLAFDELNPLLAKQLSEMEAQIGQLAQVQYDLAEERQRMRYEMEALKKAMLDSQANISQINNSQISSENDAT